MADPNKLNNLVLFPKDHIKTEIISDESVGSEKKVTEGNPFPMESYLQMTSRLSRGDGHGQLLDSNLSTESGEQLMDEGYKKLIENLDRDVRDHKQEVRDRDARLQSEMQERELRIQNEAKEREERILSAIKESADKVHSDVKEIKASVSRSEQRIDSTADHVRTMLNQNFWGWIAAVVAIIAICATIWTATKSSNPSQQPQSNPTASVNK